MRANSPQDIWSRINIGLPSECWEYQGGTFSGRYGRFSLSGKSLLAHRVVYEQCHGNVPERLFVMHKCNNKLCCNPKHLTAGTNSENQRHASISGAWRVGESGIRGVGFDKSRRYWVARAYENGKAKNLYTGPHKNKAINARMKWEKERCITFEESR